MVQLVDSDIKTREVLAWKGIHVLHGTMTPWYLGINPRGLVPVLVDDGAVHIESNDIITYLEKKFPQPQLIPAGYEHEVAKLLRHEDDLHLDIRTLSFRFVFNPDRPRKSTSDL